MTSLDNSTPKRKVLSLRKETNDHWSQPQFVEKSEAVFMVWREGGPTPKRVYAPHERQRALGHAKMLCEQTGYRFHVMRSYRAYDPATE